METKKSKEEVFEKYVDKLVKPIFDKVLKETQSNHTMVGKPPKKYKKSVTPSLYNPHNYRLYFSFTKEKYNPKAGMVGVWFGKFKNYGKEFTALGEGIRVTIKKTKAEVINKLTEQEWFYINRAKAKEEIIAILNKIDSKCIDSFKKFIEVYGGKTDFTILKRENRPDFNLFTKSDNKVLKEPFIDDLPLNMTFETDTVKKYYKKPEVEFKEPIYAANYLENSALREISPEIVTELRKLDFVFNQFSKKVTPSIEQLALNMKTHISVLKGIDKSFKRFNRLLSERQKKLGDYL